MVYCSICGKHVDKCICPKASRTVEHRVNEANKIIDPSIGKGRKTITK